MSEASRSISLNSLAINMSALEDTGGGRGGGEREGGREGGSREGGRERGGGREREIEKVFYNNAEYKIHTMYMYMYTVSVCHFFSIIAHTCAVYVHCMIIGF